MRWLYARKNESGIGAVIEFAKERLERRRCGHHPSDYPEPLGMIWRGFLFLIRQPLGSVIPTSPESKATSYLRRRLLTDDFEQKSYIAFTP